MPSSRKQIFCFTVAQLLLLAILTIENTACFLHLGINLTVWFWDLSYHEKLGALLLYVTLESVLLAWIGKPTRNTAYVLVLVVLHVLALVSHWINVLLTAASAILARFARDNPHPQPLNVNNGADHLPWPCSFRKSSFHTRSSAIRSDSDHSTENR